MRYDHDIQLYRASVLARLGAAASLRSQTRPPSCNDGGHEERGYSPSRTARQLGCGKINSDSHAGWTITRGDE
jgi:hypothetical protein